MEFQLGGLDYICGGEVQQMEISETYLSLNPRSFEPAEPLPVTLIEPSTNVHEDAADANRLNVESRSSICGSMDVRCILTTTELAAWCAWFVEDSIGLFRR